jgi:hypothetical protein
MVVIFKTSQIIHPHLSNLGQMTPLTGLLIPRTAGKKTILGDRISPKHPIFHTCTKRVDEKSRIFAVFMPFLSSLFYFMLSKLSFSHCDKKLGDLLKLNIC